MPPALWAVRSARTLLGGGGARCQVTILSRRQSAGKFFVTPQRLHADALRAPLALPTGPPPLRGGTTGGALQGEREGDDIV